MKKWVPPVNVLLNWAVYAIRGTRLRPGESYTRPDRYATAFITSGGAVYQVTVERVSTHKGNSQ